MMPATLTSRRSTHEGGPPGAGAGRWGFLVFVVLPGLVGLGGQGPGERERNGEAAGASPVAARAGGVGGFLKGRWSISASTFGPRQTLSAGTRG